MSSPAELILARCRAFASGDFAFIYDSYHPDSFFRRLYPDRQGYLDYGHAVLEHDFRIRECRILKEEVSGDRARVIYYLDVLFKGKNLESFEYCRLVREGGRWLYRSTRKLERQEFGGEMEEIGWGDFEPVRDMEF